MRGQRTPLSDFFRGRGVRREERARTPLLRDAAGIIWAAGHRIAARVKVTEETRRTLGPRWKPGSLDAEGGMRNTGEEVVSAGVLRRAILNPPPCPTRNVVAMLESVAELSHHD
ncbi:MAG: tRNA lysidine(34) synthetase TilS C-terminal domain-containing protein [Isosphaeraceae bacterium]